MDATDSNDSELSPLPPRPGAQATFGNFRDLFAAWAVRMRKDVLSPAGIGTGETFGGIFMPSEYAARGTPAELLRPSRVIELQSALQFAATPRTAAALGIPVRALPPRTLARIEKL